MCSAPFVDGALLVEPIAVCNGKVASSCICDSFNESALNRNGMIHGNKFSRIAIVAAENRGQAGEKVEELFSKEWKMVGVAKPVVWQERGITVSIFNEAHWEAELIESHDRPKS